MYTSAIVVAFICTLLICVGVIFMKWIIAQVGVTFFAVILIVMSLISLIVTGDKENGK